MTKIGRRQRGPLFILTLVATAFVVLGLAAGAYGLVRLSSYKLVQVAAESMTNTLAVGDYVVISDDAGPPRRGDIVMVAQPTRGWPAPGALVLKRVIGVGGDQVACCGADGRITVNGRPITEDYVRRDVGPPELPFSATVPAGTVFVAGDFRSNSMDSRFIAEQQQDGSVPLADVRGTVIAHGPSKTSLADLAPTTAFTDAGLAGAPASDNSLDLDGSLLTDGLLVAVLGIVALIVIGIVALVRRRAAKAKPVAPQWTQT